MCLLPQGLSRRVGLRGPLRGAAGWLTTQQNQAAFTAGIREVAARRQVFAQMSISLLILDARMCVMLDPCTGRSSKGVVVT